MVDDARVRRALHSAALTRLAAALALILAARLTPVQEACAQEAYAQEIPTHEARVQQAQAQEARPAPSALRPLPAQPLMSVPVPHLHTVERMAPLKAPDAAPSWDGSLAGTLSASQAAYTNWAEGSLNSAALAAGINGKATKEGTSWQQSYKLRLALGLLKQDTLDMRKAEDLIRFASALQYKGNGFFSTFNPTISTTARTQFAPGFNYDKVPRELKKEDRTPKLPVRVSSLLAPGIFTESIGLTYQPTKWLVQRVGVASKQTVVHVKKLRPLYNLRSSRFARFQAGLSSGTQLEREILENIHLRSSLDLFTAFNQTNETPDVTWENVVNMKVNRYFSVNLEFVALYDSNISSELQLKESLSLGVTVAMI